MSERERERYGNDDDYDASGEWWQRFERQRRRIFIRERVTKQDSSSRGGVDLEAATPT